MVGTTLRILYHDGHVNVLIPVDGTLIHVDPRAAEQSETGFGVLPSDIDVNLPPPLLPAGWVDHWANTVSMSYHPGMTLGPAGHHDNTYVHLHLHASAKPMVMVESSRPVREEDASLLAWYDGDRWWFNELQWSFEPLLGRDYPAEVRLLLARAERERKRRLEQ